jgi:hypothetical protein
MDCGCRAGGWPTTAVWRAEEGTTLGIDEQTTIITLPPQMTTMGCAGTEGLRGCVCGRRPLWGSRGEFSPVSASDAVIILALFNLPLQMWHMMRVSMQKGRAHCSRSANSMSWQRPWSGATLRIILITHIILIILSFIVDSHYSYYSFYSYLSLFFFLSLDEQVRR